jgi:dTDP-4-dehydro-6-deoxy-alpha-D-glucopyranose 2,3-dehydratase
LTDKVGVDNVVKVPLAEDFLRSSVATRVEHGAAHSLEGVRAWLAEQRRKASMRVRRVPFSELGAWTLARDGLLRLVHASGRFFTVEGARFRSSATGREWDQPVLNQPEVGLLGFLSGAINGVAHLLVQAKWEPGNGEMQLSPTVQATRSNYTRAHGGRVQPYIEHFANPSPRAVMFDALMPEHGRYFLRKFNRNVVVSVDPNLDLLDNFRWVTLGQLKALLRDDDVVHMDTRSVIACLPLVGDTTAGSLDLDQFGRAVVRSGADETDVEDVVPWLAGEEILTEARPIDDLEGWTMGAESIRPVTPRPDDFAIIAVHVEAGAREVAEWTQPMIEPLHAGFAGLLCSEMGGVMRFLVEGRAEPGYGGAGQIFPTTTWGRAVDDRLDRYFREPQSGAARFSAQNAEEGGRFFRYENRLSILELPPERSVERAPTHRWLSLGQLARLGREGLVSMELRNLLACVPVATTAED